MGRYRVLFANGTEGKLRRALGIALVVAALPLLASAQEKPQEPKAKPPGLQVVRDAVATGVSNREPVEPGQVFAPSVGRIYYFTELRAEAPPTEIAHVWYYRDREVARVSLPVQEATWRTWSSKQILPEWTGAWKVEALTPEGAVVASETFAVETPPPAPPSVPEKTEGKPPGSK